LEGLWKSESVKFELVSGTLTEEEKADFADYENANAANRKYSTRYTQFTGGKKYVFEDADVARQFVDHWNESPSAEDSLPSNISYFAITVRAVDKRTVELKGLKTGETIRLTFRTDGLDYASDNPAHASLHVPTFPKSCPTPYIAEWYLDFLGANEKNPLPVEKAGAQLRAASPKTGLGGLAFLQMTQKRGFRGFAGRSL
jgi:hypothetical protein